MLNKMNFPVIATLSAVLSIATAATADAKPKYGRAQAAPVTVVCNDRGCSDRVIAHGAEARPVAAATRTKRVRSQRVRMSEAVVTCDLRGCSDRPVAAEAGPSTRQRHRDTARVNGAAMDQRGEAVAPAVDANGNSEVVIGSRPAGCPHRFCGCEASLYVFGEIRPELNLAFNWVRKFPRTQPASGMVAARSGHVMVLMDHVGGNDWLVHDGNSGGGRTRRHVRSISGYVIVDPHGSRTAARDVNRQ